MPFIPHTEDEINDMLDTIGVPHVDALFSEYPEALFGDHLRGLPDSVSECRMLQEMRQLSENDAGYQCFMGAGAYEHHIPAAVWDLTSRGEFYSAYTPYQAEASQGTLQCLYEFQTMMCRLTALDVSNASLYDGASALAEAILMAGRIRKSFASHSVLLPSSIHPNYRKVVQTIVRQQNFKVIEVATDMKTGQIDIGDLARYAGQQITALVIPNPNFYGVVEDVDYLSNFTRNNNITSIALVNPASLALLKPPGDWGHDGVDIACGEAQPLGVPLSSGGPYLGFITCKKSTIRQLPGRISGRTVDAAGNIGYTLTLQAREQHIRRSKATSNICTNQGLLVTAATIYMSLLGDKGLYQVALASHQLTDYLRSLLAKISGVSIKYSAHHFHEFVVTLPCSAESVCQHLLERKILAGVPLSYFDGDKHELLVCVTETKTQADCDTYAKWFKQAIQKEIRKKEKCTIEQA